MNKNTQTTKTVSAPDNAQRNEHEQTPLEIAERSARYWRLKAKSIEAQRDELVAALKDIRAAAKNPDDIAEIQVLSYAALDGHLCLKKFAGRVWSVSHAAIARVDKGE